MDFSLYLVTDENISDTSNVIETIKQAVEGGVTIVQLREKKLSTRDFIDKAFRVKKALSAYKVPLIINDRVDVALAVNADGIHIGQSDMPFELVKKLIPATMIVGLSVETFEHAQMAENYDVDYLAISPVFSTPTKTNFDEKPWGLEGIKKLRKSSVHKLVAIGGINKSNAAEIIKAGADGIAVVSAICSSNDPKESARELKELIWRNKNT